MFPNPLEVMLYDAVTPVTVTSSTDATPVVVTATAHGLVTGDRVFIMGHTTNIAANGIFKVTRLSSSTFSLQDEISGADIAGSGGGAGSSGLLAKAPPVVLIQGYKNAVVQIGTTGTATTTLKAVGSLGRPKASASAPRGDLPLIGAVNSASNPYNFLQIVPMDTRTALAGGTGLVLSGADVANQYEITLSAMKYLTLIPVTWSAGVISAKLLLTTNS